ncbi:hypothetical protein [Urbifossiella limnaea]|uniref:Uncharacterized protein n=1 Tax=Urbifossiella limnaea TaxID=2528023 RepID=A0A517XV48_9BACT|nr:hypothetical protein [Urbifossiella limnaea]QDU21376.1 hypothetical protein ETAA1_33430 [Urbifossiella limnaea]
MAILDDERLAPTVRQLERHLQQRVVKLAWYHRLGVLLGRIQECSRYGDDWIRAVGGRFGLDRSLIYSTLNCAGRCSPADIRAWDGRISWAKLCVALRVKDDERRAATINRAITLAQPVREMSADVGCHEVSNRPRGGRRAAPPRSKGFERNVAGYLRQLDRQTSYQDAIFAAQSGGLLATIRDGVSTPPRVLGDLRSLVVELDRVGRTLTADAVQLADALADLERTGSEVDVS